MMQRTKNDIYAFVEKGETFHLECKKAQGGLPGSLWESYSAFCNTEPTVDLTEIRDDKEYASTLKSGLKSTLGVFQ